jgi:endo-1,4-beta-xylanase
MKTKLINLIPVISIAAMILLFVGCGNSKTGANGAGEIDSLMGLNDYYEDYFTMGVAVTPRSLEGEQSELILKNFGSLTAENAMKPGPLQPKEGEYFWDDADAIVNFAVANGLKVRGHTLCWHSQNPSWMFVDSKGDTVSKEVALTRLKEHITTVVSRYKGKVYAWDVLNEVILDDSTKYIRDTPWYKICGEEYIAKVFQWAHEADPDAILFYNDYNTEIPHKRDRIITLLKPLIDAGVPIHGMGLQAHWNLTNINEKDLRDAIEKYSALGLKIQITELDVNTQNRTETDSTKFGFTPEKEQKQMEVYKMAFNVLRDYKDVITGVTFWNVSDRSSWLDRRGTGKKAYPLLFDENLKPKKAYWEVVKF